MKHAPFRRLFSSLVSLAMILSSFSALADINDRVLVSDLSPVVSVDGSVVVTDPQDNAALIVDMITEDAGVTVSGEIKSIESSSVNKINAVRVTSQGTSSNSIDVGKGIHDITVHDSVAAVAVEIDGFDSGVASISVQDGSIVAQTDGSGSDAVGVRANMTNNASADIQAVTSGIQAETQGDSASAKALEIFTKEDSAFSIQAGEFISADTAGYNSFATGAEIYAQDGSTVTIDAGKIEAHTVGQESNAQGAEISYDDQAVVSLQSDGIYVNAEGTDSNASGIGFFETTPGGKAEIAVGSDGIRAVSAGTGGSAYGTKITGTGYLVAGDVSIVSEGDITAEAVTDAKAVLADVAQEGDVNIRTPGHIKADSAETATGAEVWSEGQFTLDALSVEASAQYDNGYAEALTVVTGENGKITVEADKFNAAAYGSNSTAHGVTFYETSPGSENSIGAGSEGITAKAEGANGDAYGVSGQIIGHNTVASQGNITAKADRTAKAVDVDVYENGTLNLFANDIIADSRMNESVGIEIAMHGGKAVVEAKNDVSAGTTGISIDNGMGKTSDVMTAEEFAAVKDKAVPAAPGSPYAFEYTDKESNTTYCFSQKDDGTLQYGEKTHYYAAESSTSVLVNGSVNVSPAATLNATGIQINSSNPDAVTDIAVGGNISVRSEDAYGISVLSSDGNSAATVDGNVAVEASGYHAYGIQAYTADKGIVNIDITGSVSASAKATTDGHGGGVGIYAGTEGAGADISISVAGNITAKARDNGQWADGILVLNNSSDGKAGQVDIRVNGDIQSTGDGVFVGGAFSEYLDFVPVVKSEEYDHTEYELIEGVGLQSEKIYYNAENGYYYNGYGNAWRIPEVTEGKNTIEVKGNVTGDDIGLAVHSHASSDIIIDGTLKGGNNAVVLTDKTVADNLKLTVWEIIPNADGSVVQETCLDQQGNRQANELEEAEKEIQYIIRLEQPEAGATLSTEGTREYEGYTVANEGDNVVLKVALQPGYMITDAFNGTDTKINLLQGEDGNYYLVVPRGGAVNLSVSLRRIITGNQSKATVSIDCNGGTLSGPLSLQVRKNDWISLPEAPTKEGSVFLGWYASECPSSDPAWTEPEAGSSLLLPAGARYQVTDNVFLIAIWQEA